jgi:hypothetical protein
MAIPHYVNENKSDIWSIKPGWYAMDEDGSLSSGPFSSREECLKGHSGNERIDLGKVASTAKVKPFAPTSDPRSGQRVRGPTENCPHEG